MGKSLTVARTQVSPTQVSGASRANALPVATPPAVVEGIVDLMVAYTSVPIRDDDDRKRLLSIYVEAVSGFDPAVVVCALEHLKLHNPRNPFRPTPQDVYEACKRTTKIWRSVVVDYFTSTRDSWSHHGMGAPPLSDGCRIPDTLVKHFLRDWLQNEYEYDQPYKDPDITRDHLLQIPEECFLPGQREAMLEAMLEAVSNRERELAEEAERDELDCRRRLEDGKTAALYLIPRTRQRFLLEYHDGDAPQARLPAPRQNDIDDNEGTDGGLR